MQGHERVVPPLAGVVPPRCPPYVEVTGVDDLLPYLEAVARRPYSAGLHAAWDLQPGERILLRLDSWYDPLCVEATIKTLEKFGCTYEIMNIDRGPQPNYTGDDEVDFMFKLTKEIAGWMETWKQIEKEGRFDKLLWGFGGPILADRQIKIQRMPFYSTEMVTSEAHTLPYEILDALDNWTWDRICAARRVRITDPEGTDLTYTNYDDYYDETRTQFNEDLLQEWYPENAAFVRKFQPGHVWGKPKFLLGKDDASGVIAGTMNHIGPFKHVTMRVENSKITEITGGGRYGDRLRDVLAESADTQYPGYPGKGLLYWWEASIGTNPKIHRPRKDYLLGMNCALYERMRSGIVHLGFGTIISSEMERQAVAQGLPAGHFHVHLNYATMIGENADGSETVIIENGRLKGLDDPKIRDIAAKYGDPDHLLSEDWIPATPGINMDGDYFADYASDPLDWTMTELHICQRWHGLYMKMIAPSDGAPQHHH
ncbi:hypothetical protein [Actinophytocola sp.]|uniref:hypothetical protein n=1 Tax=Actinophytocola sp. TaxID=1872138 RepID=UPI003D6AC3EF